MVVLKIPSFPWDFSAGLRKVQAARVLRGAKSNNGSKIFIFLFFIIYFVSRGSHPAHNNLPSPKVQRNPKPVPSGKQHRLPRGDVISLIAESTGGKMVSSAQLGLMRAEAPCSPASWAGGL